ncbi:MAG: class I SAM-dependent rRNA methyltransferase [Verrucomicrobiales bacterium]|jgi:23S rRNA (cytosine1962-C5)-methyltransferase|nr:class I SAM-dependent rRNA methyltransferase [Verrucomicrobiales bacterium]
MPMPPTLRLRVTPAAERQIRRGHPWLFDGGIRAQNRPGADGELAVIYDRRDRFLAAGLYDHASPIRVRVLHHGQPCRIDSAWFAANLDRALAMRDSLAAADTTGLRLVNGENDGWPGLVLDRYAGALALKIYTAAWFSRLPLLVNLLGEKFPAHSVVLRLSRNLSGSGDWRDGATVSGPPITDRVIFSETGLKFYADLRRGQKTGFFLDQRDNRRRVGELAAGRDMLNLFSFTGGFSLYAARGGAGRVTSVDLSQHALAELRDNWQLNHANSAVRDCPHEEIQADAFDWLAQTGRRYSLMVLDPPSLAKREADRPAALGAYQKLARAGLRRLAGRGLLVCCSCSAHVSTEDFLAVTRAAVTGSGRQIRELAVTGHPPDHRVTVEELRYLKAVYFQSA